MKIIKQEAPKEKQLTFPFMKDGCKTCCGGKKKCKSKRS